MVLRWWLGCVAAAALAVALPAAQGRQLVPPVVDLHVDLPYQMTAKGRSPAQGSGNYVAALLRDAGVVAAVLPLYVPKDVHPNGPRMEDLERVYRESHLALSGQAPWIVEPLPGACQALREGRQVSAFFSFEGATPLGFELTAVDDWVRRGVRLFGLVHSYDTPVASSAGYNFRTPGYGLTRRGKELVRRINARGAIVDVSHASDAAIADVLELAMARGAVVVATHSNARAVAAHARNLTDPQLRAIAKTGGVIGVAFHSAFLTVGKTATIDDVVRHILHVRHVAGIEAVALGSDFEGGIRPPAGMGDVRAFPRLAEALREAGLKEPEIRQIFGGNAARVLCGVAVKR